jgi:hypothetical protein
LGDLFRQFRLVAFAEAINAEARDLGGVDPALPGRPELGAGHQTQAVLDGIRFAASRLAGADCSQ